MKKTKHKSVLLKRSIDLLKINSGTYVDLTLGGGGHTFEIFEKLKEKKGTIVCIDVDSEAIKRFKKKLEDTSWEATNSTEFKKRNCTIILIQDNFSNLDEIMKRLLLENVNGCILDLGVSTDQIEDTKRGFSYMKNGPLDMRMDLSLHVTAKDLVNGLYEKELRILFEKSDERFAKRIAHEIVTQRKSKPITHTSHLVQIIQKALPYKQKGKLYTNRGYVAYWIKPVMRVFQALRIAVNSELSSLRILLPQVLEALYPGGRFVGISFHSGEDRIIKNFIIQNVREGHIRSLTRKPLKPSSEEVEQNKHARSARLRAFEKI